MTFEPQIPSWGNEYKNYLEKLKSYHDWLCKTGINNGLISDKLLQYIWDEFIVHSLYFGKILHNINKNDKNIYDLGTGGGIPGIPIALKLIKEKIDDTCFDFCNARIPTSIASELSGYGY